LGKRRKPFQDFRSGPYSRRPGIAGLYANQALEKSKTRDELLKQAIDVVFLSKSDQMAGADKSFESRRAHRSHWLEIYNSLADVKLSNEFIAVMMEQDARADGTALYWSGDLPRLIPNAERTRGAESTNEDELGHGWVAVGHLNSERYSDVNFSVPPHAMERDGTISTRDHPRALERDLTLQQPQFGRSARAIRAQASVFCGEASAPGDRLAARWAPPNLGLHRNRSVPLTTKSDPGFERRPMSGVRSLIR
jgi:hypothetical protein